MLGFLFEVSNPIKENIFSSLIQFCSGNSSFVHSVPTSPLQVLHSLEPSRLYHLKPYGRGKI